VTVNLAKQLAKATAPYPNGNVVVINHGNGYWSLYGHMSSITVQEGGRCLRKNRASNRATSSLWYDTFQLN